MGTKAKGTTKVKLFATLALACVFSVFGIVAFLIFGAKPVSAAEVVPAMSGHGLQNDPYVIYSAEQWGASGHASNPKLNLLR